MSAPPEILEEIRRRLAGRRVTIIGVGASDRCDDGFGPALVRTLSERGLPSGWTAIDAGLAPENAIGPAARGTPEVIVFADAAAMGAAPGTIALVETDAVAAFSPSTHGISLAALAEWLRLSVGLDTLLLAVEPKRVGPGRRLSSEVAGALAAVADALAGTARRVSDG
ncbi:MAG: hydrogenase maturation protease [Planctomycetes bacterium]|nr:hydrogenase maturation protease [Planctomycetota bacterium]